MKRILIINASARHTFSHSRKLSAYFTDCLLAKRPDVKIVYRDLGNSAIPAITEQWIEASHQPEDKRTQEQGEVLKLSEILLEELHNSDIIVLATPMYNWSIPSSLKAYIDQIMRVNKTFAVNPVKGGQPYIGLLKEKTLVLLLSRGGRGYGPGERNEDMDFQSPYLKLVFGVMGLKDLHEINLNGTSIGDVELAEETKGVHKQIQVLVDKLSL